MSRRRFICLDCNVDTGKLGEHYMLKDSVWWAAHPSPLGMLCIGCVESRLSRRLDSDDFNDSYINRARFCMRSARLTDRLKPR